MGDLNNFKNRLKERLSRMEHEPHWATDEADRYMASIEGSRKQWQELASRMCTEVIRPRLEVLVGCFPQAKMATNEPFERNTCWFGYCERFPASVRLSFALEHDVRYENAVMSFEAQMVPAFIKFNECDRLTLPLSQFSEAVATGWIEKRLWEFLDAYLQIDRGADGLDDEVVTDPVCGMRISRSAAAARFEHLGHPYFFCSQGCHSRFSANPRAYVQVKTI